MKIAILGCGAYGLALAMQLNEKNDVVIYTKFEQEKEEVENLNYRENVLPGVLLPQLQVTLSLKEALKEADFVFFAVPFSYLEETLLEALPYLSKESVLVIAAKGIRKEDGKTGPEIFKERTHHPFMVISGPTFAIDLARGETLKITVAAEDKTLFEKLRTCFPSHIFLEYEEDIIGISYCGAIKNVFAILTGYLAGENASTSTLAAVLYSSLKQIEKILIATSCHSKSILTAAGVGDFYMSAESKKSRNYTFGVLLATKTKEEITAYLENTTVEGVNTLKSCLSLCQKMKIEIPIFSLLEEILNGKNYSALEILEVLSE